MHIIPQNQVADELSYTKDERWRQHISEQKISGLSRMAYCQKHRLSYYQFGYWARKYQVEALPSTDLVRICLNKQPHLPQATVCTLVLNNGYELKIHDKELLPMLLSMWG